MEEFVFFVIKYTAVYAATAYAYAKLTRNRLCFRDLFSLPAFAVLSAGLYYLCEISFLFGAMCLVFSNLVILSVRFRHGFTYNMSAGLMALGMAIYLRFPAYIIVAPLYALVYIVDNMFLINVVGFIFLGIIQNLLLFGLFKLKLLRNGISFDNGGMFAMLLNVANVLCIFAGLMLNLEFSLEAVFELGEFAVTVSGITILFLWRKNSIDGYTRQQAGVERAVVEQSVEAFGRQTYLLERENGLLGKIIHRDNKIIPAAVMTVAAAIKKYRDPELYEILGGVKRYGAERALDLAAFRARPQLAKTNVAMIDSILCNLQLAAYERGITLDTEVYGDVSGWFENGGPDKTSVNVLLSYLGDNAVISAGKKQDGRVKIVIGRQGFSGAYIAVYDNGAPFNESVISAMGVARITTRKNEGGNGYGLQTLFETVRRYEASFTLDELCGDGYAKCLEVRFDRRRAVTLRTKRRSAIKAAARRSDLTVVTD